MTYKNKSSRRKYKWRRDGEGARDAAVKKLRNAHFERRAYSTHYNDHDDNNNHNTNNDNNTNSNDNDDNNNNVTHTRNNYSTS